MRHCVVAVLAGACWSRAPQAPPPASPPAPTTDAAIDAPVLSETVSKQKQNCASRDAWDCVRVGLAYHTGDGAPLDVPLAARYYQLACDVNIPEACALLINLYRGGTEALAPDPDRVRELSAKLCALGFDDYCVKPPADP
jgi:hypothetical protein